MKHCRTHLVTDILRYSGNLITDQHSIASLLTNILVQNTINPINTTRYRPCLSRHHWQTTSNRICIINYHHKVVIETLVYICDLHETDLCVYVIMMHNTSVYIPNVLNQISHNLCATVLNQIHMWMRPYWRKPTHRS